MSAPAEIFTADLRLAILQVLVAAGHETNVGIVKASVAATTMHRPSGNQVRTEILWLSERGLVAKRSIGAAVEAATITERGEDVAEGRERVPGVAWPEGV